MDLKEDLRNLSVCNPDPANLNLRPSISTTPLYLEFMMKLRNRSHRKERGFLACHQIISPLFDVRNLSWRINTNQTRIRVVEYKSLLKMGVLRLSMREECKSIFLSSVTYRRPGERKTSSPWTQAFGALSHSYRVRVNPTNMLGATLCHHASPTPLPLVRQPKASATALMWCCTILTMRGRWMWTGTSQVLWRPGQAVRARRRKYRTVLSVLDLPERGREL